MRAADGPEPRVERRAPSLLHRGGLAQADLRLVESPDGDLLVLKDYSARPAWLRFAWSRWLCAREQFAYRAIEQRLGARGWLPGFRGSVGREGFLLSYRPGRPLSRALAGELPSGFVDELDEAVQALHGVGVVHLDLSHRSNVLVDACGHPVLLDFASALVAPPGGLRARMLVALLGGMDRRAIRKWRRKLSGA